VGGQLLVAAALTPEKEPEPPVRRLGGTQSRSGRFKEELIC
jgi:hypothetical protein